MAILAPAKGEISVPVLRHYVGLCSPAPSNDNGIPRSGYLVSEVMRAIPGSYHRRPMIGGVKLRESWERRALEAVSGPWGDASDPDDLPMEWKVSLETVRKGRLRGTRIHEVVEELHFRRSMNEPHYRLAGFYLYDTDWSLYPEHHRGMWEMHASGATIREIVARFKMSTREAHRILKIHKILAHSPNGGMGDA